MKDIQTPICFTNRENEPVSIALLSRLRSLGHLLLCLVLGLMTSSAEAQFAPTLSTSFDNLEAGLPSGFSQSAFFAEGEEEKTIRAALSFYNAGFGIPILIGRENRVRETMEEVNLEGLSELIIHNASLSKNNKKNHQEK